ncbi:similar to Saccharomyces cerevisiae YNL162W-A Putative protein of unknown function [Geotrichum candidum]|uniref:Uncharacterized protein n=1 Tax=Geotrichum candidum TaxID=1173061 RepID=A0A0J9XFC6_GEOCN|nr:similar to Saccharomyces cerevisiae YNL162W-A Putative protein of unknown function [Geotrichum candidum]
MTEDSGLCPICGTTLKRVLLDVEKALEVCPVLTCVYPFNNENVDHLVSTVSEDEVLKNVADRMKRANLDSDIISKLARS